MKFLVAISKVSPKKESVILIAKIKKYGTKINHEILEKPIMVTEMRGSGVKIIKSCTWLNFAIIYNFIP